MTDHERIYLQPGCCVDPGEGRLWCEDNVWPIFGDCDQKGVEYVRADIAAQAERAAIVAWLREQQKLVDGSHNYWGYIANAIQSGEHLRDV